jgi:hypothetical protein
MSCRRPSPLVALRVMPTVLTASGRAQEPAGGLLGFRGASEGGLQPLDGRPQPNVRAWRPCSDAGHA